MSCYGVLIFSSRIKSEKEKNFEGNIGHFGDYLQKKMLLKNLVGELSQLLLLFFPLSLTKQKGQEEKERKRKSKKEANGMEVKL